MTQHWLVKHAYTSKTTLGLCAPSTQPPTAAFQAVNSTPPRGSTRAHGGFEARAVADVALFLSFGCGCELQLARSAVLCCRERPCITLSRHTSRHRAQTPVAHSLERLTAARKFLNSPSHSASSLGGHSSSHICLGVRVLVLSRHLRSGALLTCFVFRTARATSTTRPSIHRHEPPQRARGNGSRSAPLFEPLQWWQRLCAEQALTPTGSTPTVYGSQPPALQWQHRRCRRHLAGACAESAALRVPHRHRECSVQRCFMGTRVLQLRLRPQAQPGHVNLHMRC
jgi:hypothetical protein